MKSALTIIVFFFLLSPVFGQFNQKVICDIPGQNLYYSPQDQYFYGSVQIDGEQFLVRVDPNFCLLVDSTPIPLNSQIISLSEDESKFYFSLYGEGMVIFDIVTQSFGELIDLGSEDGSPFYPTSVKGLPQTEETNVVISRIAGNATDRQLAVFDGIQAREETISPSQTPGLIVTPDSNIVFGADNTTTAHKFYKFNVDDDGLSVEFALSNAQSPAPAFADRMVYYDSLIYFNNGTVVDPFNGLPSVHGQFVFPDIDPLEDFEFAIDEYIEVIWWLWHDDYDSLRLAAYDLKTMDLLYQVNPHLKNCEGELRSRSLVSWGLGNLAFTYSPFCGVSPAPYFAPKWCLLSNCINPISTAPYSIDTVPACQGDTLTIEGEPGYSHYLWSTGSTNQSISSADFAQWTNTCSYQVINENGCASPPAITTIDFNNYPSPPQFDEFIEYQACPGQQFELSTLFDNPLYTILWSNGTNSNILFLNSGLGATAQYISPNGTCISEPSEYIFIEQLDSPTLPEVELFPQTILCHDDILSVEIIGNYSSYYWDPGFDVVSGDSSEWNVTTEIGELELNSDDFLTTEGIIRLTVFNELGCSTTLDSIEFFYESYPSFISLQALGEPVEELCIQYATSAPEVHFDSYKWYLDSELLASSEDSCITPSYSGIYTIVGQKGECFIQASKSLTTSMIENISAHYDQSNTMIVLNYDLNPSNDYLLTIHDLRGREILSHVLDSTLAFDEIDFSSFDSSTYLISVFNLTQAKRIYSTKVPVTK